MQQLSGLDATFLYIESTRAPMHVGGVYIFEPPQKGDRIDYYQFRDFIESRLHISRVFRQRLVEAPLDMSHPYWIEDPHFDLEYHLQYVAIPQPGGSKELLDLAARIFSRTMDRKRPLWELTIVEGLNIEGYPKNSFALISKVHHAAIDGGSGAEMMGALLSPSPKKSKPTSEEEHYWESERIPTGIEIVARNYIKSVGTPVKLAKFLYDAIGSTIDVAREAIGKWIEPPPMPFTAPTTLFNAPVTPHRIFDGANLDLERIKKMKNIASTTVNNVVLAICAGALRRYLKDKNNLPKKPLVAMAPVSVRNEEEKGTMGNKVSAMLVSLATNEEDPLKRLKLIHESASSSKVYSRALGADKIMDLVPSELAALAARLYTETKVVEYIRPVYNLVITNVPGPPIPLYMGGAKLLTHYGTAPLIDGLGLLMVVFSYAGSITISATSCRELMPDLDKFIANIYEAADELEQTLEVLVAAEEKLKKSKEAKKVVKAKDQK